MTGHEWKVEEERSFRNYQLANPGSKADKPLFVPRRIRAKEELKKAKQELKVVQRGMKKKKIETTLSQKMKKLQQKGHKQKEPKYYFKKLLHHELWEYLQSYTTHKDGLFYKKKSLLRYPDMRAWINAMYGEFGYGILVLKLDKLRPAKLAGMKNLDLITEVNGHPVHNLADFEKLIANEIYKKINFRKNKLSNDFGLHKHLNELITSNILLGNHIEEEFNFHK